MSELRKAIVIPDIHAPFHDEPAFNCILQCIEIAQPDTAIVLGDLCELGSVSPWKYRRRKRPDLDSHLKHIDKDISVGNDILDTLDFCLDENGTTEKYFCEGNHEIWLDNFIEEYPFLEKDYAPANAFKLEDRGYMYLPYGEYLTIGKLNFYHGGHYHGKYHAMYHVATLGANVVYAHMHDVSRQGLASLSGVHAAWCIGSLKNHDNKSNQWLRGRKVNWSHAFAVVYWFEEGSFRVEVVDITGGKTIFMGEEIDGNLAQGRKYDPVRSNKQTRARHS
jgi:hypothetical protein